MTTTNILNARKNRKARKKEFHTSNPTPTPASHNAKSCKALRKLAGMYSEANKYPELAYIEGTGTPPQFQPITEPFGSETRVIGFMKVGRGTPLRHHPKSTRGLYRYWKKFGIVAKSEEAA